MMSLFSRLWGMLFPRRAAHLAHASFALDGDALIVTLRLDDGSETAFRAHPQLARVVGDHLTSAAIRALSRGPTTLAPGLRATEGAP